MSVVRRIPEWIVELLFFVLENHLVDDLLDEIGARLLATANARVQLVGLAELCEVCFVFKHSIARFVDPDSARGAADHVRCGLLGLVNEFEAATTVHFFVTLLVTSMAQLEVS